MFDTINYELKDNVAYITLNRPESYNSINEQLGQEFIKAFTMAKEDEEVRVVVLTGAGEKAFCSGQDLKEVEGSANQFNLGVSVENRYNKMVRSMVDLPKPIVGRVNGVAAGAGCSFALACDILVASENASMIEVFVNIGLVLDSGSSFFLPRIVGSKKAFELCTLGSKVKAADALELGLVNRVVPMSELDEEVKKFTDYYRKAPTKAIGMIKKMLYKSHQSDINQMLEYEFFYQDMAGRSEDYQEGVRAFNEKRKPEFKGK